MPKVSHFEIHADDPERAVGFYQNVFDWSFTKWSGGDYWLATAGPDDEPGINGGIIRREAPTDGKSVNAYVCSISVPAIDHYLELIPIHGGEITAPKNAVPGVGWLAYARDTEGNLFAMFQDDTSAE